MLLPGDDTCCLPIYLLFFMLLPGDDTFCLPIYFLIILCSY
jgi:hypothetical protein